MERTRRRDYNFCDLDEDQEDPPTSASASAAASSSTTNTTVHWGPQASPSEAPSSSTPAAAAAAVEKEHMFDKIVTPSDVGKLNRLVIPKQHAEKYFPLDTTTHEKGLLLNFEDRTGKPWRFRYSYWNSSQSYVMTKGWSRFVKEKRLDAGDTVSFGRGVVEKDRLFIDWKRRPDIQNHQQHRMPRIPMPITHMNNYGYASYHHQQQQLQHSLPMVSFSRSVGPWAGRLLVPPTAGTTVNQQHRQNYIYNNAAGVVGGPTAQYLVFRSAGIPPQAAAVQLGGGSHAQDETPMVLDSVPVVQSQAAAKRFRLFGVNMDFPETTSEGDAVDNSSIPSQGSSPQSSGKGKEKEEPSLDLDM